MLNAVGSPCAVDTRGNYNSFISLRFVPYWIAPSIYHLLDLLKPKFLQTWVSFTKRATKPEEDGVAVKLRTSNPHVLCVTSSRLSYTWVFVTSLFILHRFLHSSVTYLTNLSNQTRGLLSISTKLFHTKTEQLNHTKSVIIYIYMCVCVCVCVFCMLCRFGSALQKVTRRCPSEARHSWKV